VLMMAVSMYVVSLLGGINVVRTSLELWSVEAKVAALDRA
jgi:hypothetical protein